MGDDITERLVRIEEKIGRLVSDAESEKETRSRANAFAENRMKSIEARLQELETSGQKFDILPEELYKQHIWSVERMKEYDPAKLEDLQSVIETFRWLRGKVMKFLGSMLLICIMVLMVFGIVMMISHWLGGK